MGELDKQLIPKIKWCVQRIGEKMEDDLAKIAKDSKAPVETLKKFLDSKKQKKEGYEKALAAYTDDKNRLLDRKQKLDDQYVANIRQMDKLSIGALKYQSPDVDKKNPLYSKWQKQYEEVEKLKRENELLDEQRAAIGDDLLGLEKTKPVFPQTYANHIQALEEKIKALEASRFKDIEDMRKLVNDSILTDADGSREKFAKEIMRQVVGQQKLLFKGQTDFGDSEIDSMLDAASLVLDNIASDYDFMGQYVTRNTHYDIVDVDGQKVRLFRMKEFTAKEFYASLQRYFTQAFFPILKNRFSKLLEERRRFESLDHRSDGEEGDRYNSIADQSAGVSESSVRLEALKDFYAYANKRKSDIVKDVRKAFDAQASKMSNRSIFYYSLSEVNKSRLCSTVVENFIRECKSDPVFPTKYKSRVIERWVKSSIGGLPNRPADLSFLQNMCKKLYGVMCGYVSDSVGAYLKSLVGGSADDKQYVRDVAKALEMYISNGAKNRQNALNDSGVRLVLANKQFNVWAAVYKFQQEMLACSKLLLAEEN